MSELSSARIGAKAELLGLRLSNLTARTGSAAFANTNLALQVAVSPKFYVDEGVLLYNFEFNVRVTSGRRLAWKLTAPYEVAFTVPAGFEASDEEYIAFGESTAMRVAFPYLRQLVNSLSLEFAMPPALLGLIRVWVDGDEVTGPGV